jgi:hypothetical protein
MELTKLLEFMSRAECPPLSLNGGTSTESEAGSRKLE